MKATIEEFVGQWLELPDSSRTALGVSAQVSTLGRTAVLGRRVFRYDQKFRMVLGPLTSAEFGRLLPGGTTLVELRDVVRAYICDELDWDVRLELAEGESDQGRARRGPAGWVGMLDSAKPAGWKQRARHRASGDGPDRTHCRGVSSAKTKTTVRKSICQGNQHERDQPRQSVR